MALSKKDSDYFLIEIVRKLCLSDMKVAFVAAGYIGKPLIDPMGVLATFVYGQQQSYKQVHLSHNYN